MAQPTNSPFGMLMNDYSKFVGITTDLQLIRMYINDMRMCFLLMTVSAYVGGIIYALIACCRMCRGWRRGRKKSGYSQKGHRHLNGTNGSIPSDRRHLAFDYTDVPEIVLTKGGEKDMNGYSYRHARVASPECIAQAVRSNVAPSAPYSQTSLGNAVDGYATLQRLPRQLGAERNSVSESTRDSSMVRRESDFTE